MEGYAVLADERRSPHRAVLADSVYEAVKAMVMDHEIKPGERVGIDALARTLKVSPTPVREALARLTADGLVVKRSLAGYRTTELLTPRGMAELFEMRLLLEPAAAAHAARNGDDAQLDRLEALVDQMRACPYSEESYARYGEFAGFDQRFHDDIADMSGQSLLADAIRRLHSHLHIFRLGGVPHAGEPTIDEHEQVLRAIIRRNPDRAAEAMRSHLLVSLERQRARLTD